MALIEVLFAILVLAVGILALASAMAYGLRGGDEGARMTEATGFARRLIDEVRSRNLPFSTPINDAASARVALNAAPFGGASGLPNNPGMTRNLTMTLLKATKTGASDDYKNDLAEITVRVYWWDKNAEKFVEFKGLHRRP